MKIMTCRADDGHLGGGSVGDADQAAAAMRRGAGGALHHVGDAELLLLIGLGGSDALAESYARHGATVYKLARRLCGPMPAVEVTRAVFLLMWKSPGIFDTGIGSMRSRLLDETSALSYDLLGTNPLSAPEQSWSAMTPLVHVTTPVHW
jgi:hypothetical protein